MNLFIYVSPSLSEYWGGGALSTRKEEAEHFFSLFPSSPQQVLNVSAFKV